MSGKARSLAADNAKPISGRPIHCSGRIATERNVARRQVSHTSLAGNTLNQMREAAIAAVVAISQTKILEDLQ